jgi:cytochrome P450
MVASVALVFVIFVATVIVVTAVKSQLRRKELNLPEGPPSLPLVENALVFFRDPVSALTKYSKKYGPMFTLDYQGGHLVVVSDLDILNYINKNDKFLARNDLVNEGLKKVEMFESGVIGNNHVQKWKHSRGLVLGTANNKDLNDYTAQTILELLDKESNTTLQAACASSSKKIVMKPLLMRIMIELLGKTLFDLNPEFDVSLSAKLADWIDHFLGAWTFFVTYPPWLWNLFPATKKSHEKCIKEFYEFEEQFIDRKKAQFKDIPSDQLNKKDLMFAMFELEKNDVSADRALSRNDIRSILNDVILGGTDTTANSTSMAVYHLSRHLELQDRLYDELSDHLAKNGGVFEPKSIAKLPFLDAVVQEVMRMFPPTTIITRQAVEDTELEGYTLRKGTVVLMNLYAAYHNEKHWKNPEVFNPDRFLEASLPKVYAFGLGKRSCPGQALGAMNTKLILAKLFSKFRFTAIRPEEKLQGTYQLVYSIDPKSTDVFVERR